MPLRPQQEKLNSLVSDISNGAPIKDIVLYWAPGGGKSLAPVILSQLITLEKKKIVWVVPRNSLKSQGESDFQNEFFPVDKQIRIADNSGDPFRGCAGCVTTYQAISANPELWEGVSNYYEILLILDEMHHLSKTGDWISIIQKMYDKSFLRVMMTGTISRGDEKKIPFIPYNSAFPDFQDTNSLKWVIYTRDQALEDGSILPFEVYTINGSGEYIDLSGVKRYFKRFQGSGDELRTALTTEYAYTLLNLVIKNWMKYKKKHPWAKFLIVSPDIKTAREYTIFLRDLGIICDIATSDNNSECKASINKFKKNNDSPEALHGLVSVGVAYEGLNVPAITHMGILTIIRSIPWLDQCFARSARNHKGKKTGYIYAPKDPKLLKAVRSISGGDVLPVSLEIEVEEIEPQAQDDDDRFSLGKQQIEALSSKAHIDIIHNDRLAPQDPTQNKETPSQKEARFRSAINKHIEETVESTGHGNKGVKKKLFWLRIKQIVNNGRDDQGRLITKPLKEMSIKELEKVYDFIK